MKQYLLAILFIVTMQTKAQQYVLDKEQYLTIDEISRIDSMLSAFHKRTGKVLLMSTDSLKINESSYQNELFSRYYNDSSSSETVLMLIMSRKNQLVQMTACKALRPLLPEPKMLEMVNAGLPSLAAKRREEGVTLILRKAMETLESL